MSTLCTHCGTKINNYTMRGEHYCDRCRIRQQTSTSSIDRMRLGDFLPAPSAPAHRGYTEHGDTTCSSCTAPIRWWTFRSGRNAPFEAQPLTGLPHHVRFLVVAGKDVVDVGAAVAVMGDSSAAQTALEVGGPQARPLISC